MSERPRDLDLVRKEVRAVLGQSEQWRRLEPEQRRAFAQNMVKVGHFLARDPGWLDAPVGQRGARAQAAAEALGPIDNLRQRLADKPGQVGAEFQAGATRQGVKEFGNLVQTVDFPEFVSSLIQGVFQAIVDASIQQMEAYGELLSATAKSVDQFAKDHISDDQVRENLASRHPSLVRVVPTATGTKLAAQDGVDDLAELKHTLKVAEGAELDSEEGEAKFIYAAKLEMARQRQKLMALMVMLGINRIIVTNGRINAKVVFDIEASDYAKRRAQASLDDQTDTTSGAVAGFALPWGGGGGYRKRKHRTTVKSSIDDRSESKAEMSARLSGDVRVNFRSETLPPERMLDALDLGGEGYLAQLTAAKQGGAAPPNAAATKGAKP